MSKLSAYIPDGESQEHGDEEAAIAEAINGETEQNGTQAHSGGQLADEKQEPGERQLLYEENLPGKSKEEHIIATEEVPLNEEQLAEIKKAIVETIKDIVANIAAKVESRISLILPDFVPKKLRWLFNDKEIGEAIEWFEQKCKMIPDIGCVMSVQGLIEFCEQRQILHRRSFGKPTYGDLMTYIEKIDQWDYTLEQFLNILTKWTVEPDKVDELKLAFRVFDTEDQGFLNLVRIKAFLLQYEDPFTNAELTEILREMNSKGHGNVDYESFVDLIFLKAPELKDIHIEYIYEPDDDPTVPPLPPLPEPPKIPSPPPEEEPPKTKAKKGKGKSKKGKKK